jgi:c-di-GMP-binding flagellar brake protein YcgR
MTETTMPTKAKAKKAKPAKKKIVLPVTINRRQEWRFDLPLTVTVEGQRPSGKPFREIAKLTNISSGGAYLHLNTAVTVGSKVILNVDLPRELTDGQKVRLVLTGVTVRLQRPEKKGKRQGVAVRFGKGFRFHPAAKSA